MQINRVIEAGRLTKTVKYGATKNGTPKAQFTLAQNQGKHTNFFTIIAFGKRADYAHKWLHQAQRITIDGQLNHHIVQSDGNYKNYYSIIVDRFDAIHPKHQKQSPSVKKLYSKYDDLTKKVDQISKDRRNKKGNPK